MFIMTGTVLKNIMSNEGRHMLNERKHIRLLIKTSLEFISIMQLVQKQIISYELYILCIAVSIT